MWLGKIVCVHEEAVSVCVCVCVCGHADPVRPFHVMPSTVWRTL